MHERATHEDQITRFLSDLYSMELQALVQLRSAPQIAGDPVIAGHFRKHHEETQRQAELVLGRLEALGGSVSGIKDAVMKMGGEGFLLFARAQSETPGRLLAHAYSYEAMEWGGYEMLRLMCLQRGDAETAELARRIRDEEQEMLDRLGSCFDEAEHRVHERQGGISQEHLIKHLGEAHALEAQSEKLLEKAVKIGGAPSLISVYRLHLEQTRRQSRRLEERIDELGGYPSRTKDAMMRIGAVEWGMFFQAQGDTPTKLAAFAYAYEHLEIAGYELLARTARRRGDAKTERLCREILAEEREAAVKLAVCFEDAVDTVLEEHAEPAR